MTRDEPHVGDVVAMQRSGHSPGACEHATVVAIAGRKSRPILRLRWSDGHDSFVPATVVLWEAPASRVSG